MTRNTQECKRDLVGLGDCLQERIDAAGTNQSELAHEIGVKPQSISKLVNGISGSSRYLHKIARALGTTPEYLTGETNDPGGHAPEIDLGFEERTLLESFRALSEANRKLVVALARSLAERTEGMMHAPGAAARATVHSAKQGYKAG